MTAKVIVLLSTYNGEKYLDEQLDSLLSQTVKVDILVRDDGSNDSTVAILDKYRQKGFLNYYVGNNVGVANSFLDLIQKSDESEYYAFCDQDDIWDNDKIEQAVNCLSVENKSEALLYMGAQRTVDENLKPLNSRKIKNKKLTFGNSLIQSAAIGCTFVFNSVLAQMFKEKNPEGIFMHDWFLHKAAAACGKVVFDNVPHIQYRQHSANVIGGQVPFFKRVKNNITGKSRGVRYKDAIILEDYFSDYMLDERKKTLKILTSYKKNFASRLCLMFNKEIKATKFIDRIFFRILTLLGRL